MKSTSINEKPILHIRGIQSANSHIWCSKQSKNSQCMHVSTFSMKPTFSLWSLFFSLKILFLFSIKKQNKKRRKYLHALNVKCTCKIKIPWDTREKKPVRSVSKGNFWYFLLLSVWPRKTTHILQKCTNLVIHFANFSLLNAHHCWPPLSPIARLAKTRYHVKHFLQLYMIIPWNDSVDLVSYTDMFNHSQCKGNLFWHYF